MIGNRAFVGGGDTHPFSIYQSVDNDPTQFFVPGISPAEVVARYDFDSAIVGIVANQDTLYVFTKRSVWKTAGTQSFSGKTIYQWTKLEAYEGAISQASIVPALNKVWWVTPSGKIMNTGFNQGGYTEQVMDISHRPNTGISQLIDKIFYPYKQ